MTDPFDSNVGMLKVDAPCDICEQRAIIVVQYKRFCITCIDRIWHLANQKAKQKNVRELLEHEKRKGHNRQQIADKVRQLRKDYGMT